jgi:hypothetical protein
MLTRATILEAFQQLSGELAKKEIVGELCVVGGTAMVLAFNARGSTKDVDAIFEPSAAVRGAAQVVARNLSLPEDWLNDAAKGFLSPSADFAPIDALDLPNLRVQAPTPEYMLAMKVLSARTGVSEERGDPHDIAFLIRLLGLKDADAVMAIVERYYDRSRILPRSSYLVDQILEEMQF